MMEKCSFLLLLKITKVNIFHFILLLFFKDQVCMAVQIKRLSIPRWIENGTEKPVVLDCEYVYNENDLRLVVKWFFEDNLEPVYQWIPELNLRHISNLLKDKLDLEFAVNTVDSYSRLRALKIIKPSTELSGRYTCLVTSLAGQDSRNQVMTVFVPALAFDMSYQELSDASLNVTCAAHRLFPPPVLKLYLDTAGNNPTKPVNEITLLSEYRNSGVYDAYLFRTFGASELPSESASVFECSLILPGTNYAKAKRLAYYPGGQKFRINAAHSLSSTSQKLSNPSFLIYISVFIVSIISPYWSYVRSHENVNKN